MPERYTGERRWAPDDGGRYEADERRRDDYERSRHSREDLGYGREETGREWQYAERGGAERRGRGEWESDRGYGREHRPYEANREVTGERGRGFRDERRDFEAQSARQGRELRREPMRDYRPRDDDPYRSRDDDPHRQGGVRSGAFGRDDYDDYGEPASFRGGYDDSYRGRDYADEGRLARGRERDDAYRGSRRTEGLERGASFGNRDQERSWRERWMSDRSPSAYQSGVHGGESRGGWSGGGAARGGDYTRPLGEFSGRGPRGYARSDDRIRDEICDLLTADPDVDATEITVLVQQGEVTLSGTVGDRRQKRAAEDLADGVPGVGQVHNHLRVEGGAYGESSRTTPLGPGQVFPANAGASMSGPTQSGAGVGMSGSGGSGGGASNASASPAPSSSYSGTPADGRTMTGPRSETPSRAETPPFNNARQS